MKLKTYGLIFFSCLVISACHKSKHDVNGYVEGENIYLSSPFYGVLEQLSVQRGQQVKKGQLLFQLDPNPQQFQVKQVQSELQQAVKILLDLEKPKRLPEISAAQAQVDQADAQIKLAEIRLDRLRKLFARQATDRDSVDAAVANLKQLQQLKQQYQDNLKLATLGSREDQISAQREQIKALEAKLKQAQWELAQKTVFSPDTGVIYDTYFQVGELVGSQQPVVALLTPHNTRIEFFVPLDWVASLHLGQLVTFDCEGCKMNNRAKINYISPDAEFVPPLVYSRDNYSNLVFRVKAYIANPEFFKPGQPVVVTL